MCMHMCMHMCTGPHQQSRMLIVLSSPQALNNAQATFAGFGLINSENVFKARDSLFSSSRDSTDTNYA